MLSVPLGQTVSQKSTGLPTTVSKSQGTNMSVTSNSTTADIRRSSFSFIPALLLAFVVGCTSTAAYATAKMQVSIFAEQGAQRVLTGGFQSLTKVQRSFPGATVSVYGYGGTTLSTIYSDSSGTAKANPFTAGTDGYAPFWADVGNYDITFSGTGITTGCGGAGQAACIVAFTRTVFVGATLGTSADGLNSLTTVVNTSNATAPTVGQVLRVTDSQHMTWQTPLITWLSTFSSSTLRSQITDPTGTGLAVFNDSPTMSGSVLFNSPLAGAIILKPSSAPSGGVKLFDLQTTGGSSRFSIDKDGNVAAAAATSWTMGSGSVALSNLLSYIAWLNVGTLQFAIQPPVYANNAAALAGGLVAGNTYRTGGDPDFIAVVH